MSSTHLPDGELLAGEPEHLESAIPLVQAMPALLAGIPQQYHSRVYNSIRRETTIGELLSLIASIKKEASAGRGQVIKLLHTRWTRPIRCMIVEVVVYLRRIFGLQSSGLRNIRCILVRIFFHSRQVTTTPSGATDVTTTPSPAGGATAVHQQMAGRHLYEDVNIQISGLDRRSANKKAGDTRPSRTVSAGDTTPSSSSSAGTFPASPPRAPANNFFPPTPPPRPHPSPASSTSAPGTSLPTLSSSPSPISEPSQSSTGRRTTVGDPPGRSPRTGTTVGDPPRDAERVQHFPVSAPRSADVSLLTWLREDFPDRCRHIAEKVVVGVVEVSRAGVAAVGEVEWGERCRDIAEKGRSCAAAVVAAVQKVEWGHHFQCIAEAFSWTYRAMSLLTDYVGTRMRDMCEERCRAAAGRAMAAADWFELRQLLSTLCSAARRCKAHLGHRLQTRMQRCRSVGEHFYAGLTGTEPPPPAHQTPANSASSDTPSSPEATSSPKDPTFPGNFPDLSAGTYLPAAASSRRRNKKKKPSPEDEAEDYELVIREFLADPTQSIKELAQNCLLPHGKTQRLLEQAQQDGRVLQERNRTSERNRTVAGTVGPLVRTTADVCRGFAQQAGGVARQDLERMRVDMRRRIEQSEFLRQYGGEMQRRLLAYLRGRRQRGAGRGGGAAPPPARDEEEFPEMTFFGWLCRFVVVAFCLFWLFFAPYRALVFRNSRRTTNLAVQLTLLKEQTTGADYYIFSGPEEGGGADGVFLPTKTAKQVLARMIKKADDIFRPESERANAVFVIYRTLVDSMGDRPAYRVIEREEGIRHQLLREYRLDPLQGRERADTTATIRSAGERDGDWALQYAVASDSSGPRSREELLGLKERSSPEQQGAIFAELGVTMDSLTAAVRLMARAWEQMNQAGGDAPLLDDPELAQLLLHDPLRAVEMIVGGEDAGDTKTDRESEDEDESIARGKDAERMRALLGGGRPGRPGREKATCAATREDRPSTPSFLIAFASVQHFRATRKASAVGLEDSEIGLEGPTTATPAAGRERLQKNSAHIVRAIVRAIVIFMEAGRRLFASSEEGADFDSPLVAFSSSLVQIHTLYLVDLKKIPVYGATSVALKELFYKNVDEVTLNNAFASLVLRFSDGGYFATTSTTSSVLDDIGVDFGLFFDGVAKFAGVCRQAADLHTETAKIYDGDFAKKLLERAAMLRAMAVVVLPLHLASNELDAWPVLGKTGRRKTVTLLFEDEDPPDPLEKLRTSMQEWRTVAKSSSVQRAIADLDSAGGRVDGGVDSLLQQAWGGVERFVGRTSSDTVSLRTAVALRVGVMQALTALKNPQETAEAFDKAEKRASARLARAAREAFSFEPDSDASFLSEVLRSLQSEVSEWARDPLAKTLLFGRGGAPLLPSETVPQRESRLLARHTRRRELVTRAAEGLLTRDAIRTRPAFRRQRLAQKRYFYDKNSGRSSSKDSEFKKWSSYVVFVSGENDKNAGAPVPLLGDERKSFREAERGCVYSLFVCFVKLRQNTLVRDTGVSAEQLRGQLEDEFGTDPLLGGEIGEDGGSRSFMLRVWRDNLKRSEEGDEEMGSEEAGEDEEAGGEGFVTEGIWSDLLRRAVAEERILLL